MGEPVKCAKIVDVPQPHWRHYALTDGIRKKISNPSPADEQRGYVLLKVPIHLEDLYFNLAYGDVHDA